MRFDLWREGVAGWIGKDNLLSIDLESLSGHIRRFWLLYINAFKTLTPSLCCRS